MNVTFQMLQTRFVLVTQTVHAFSLRFNGYNTGSKTPSHSDELVSNFPFFLSRYPKKLD
jgi:hypothetical protein